MDAIEKEARKSVELGRPLTTEELAWWLRLTPRTIDDMRRDGEITPCLDRKGSYRYHPDILINLKSAGSHKEDVTPRSLKSEKKKQRPELNLLGR